MTTPAPAWRLWHGTPGVRALMLATLGALLPGIGSLLWLRGADLVPGIGVAIAIALMTEGVLLKRRTAASVSDFSAVVTAVLLALLLPVDLPWWMTGLGVITALAVAKHAFGGLGENIFNPAMFGLALLALLFPGQFTESGDAPGLIALASFTVGGIALASASVNGWQAPLAMLGGAGAGFACLGAPELAWQVEMAALPVVLGAFFVVTDPVSGCLSARGRALFGLGVGLLLVFYGRLGSVSMALPFAVLTMNCLAPWLDRHTGPRGIATAAAR